jgi:predicted transcriptional regulator
MAIVEKTHTFSIRLPQDIRFQVDHLAKVTKRSRSFIIKEAVQNYMRDRT